MQISPCCSPDAGRVAHWLRREPRAGLNSGHQKCSQNLQAPTFLSHSHGPGTPLGRQPCPTAGGASILTFGPQARACHEAGERSLKQGQRVGMRSLEQGPGVRGPESLKYSQCQYQGGTPNRALSFVSVNLPFPWSWRCRGQPPCGCLGEAGDHRPHC